ncbi:hypothetical protein [Demequina litorisediminis]|uniref:Xyloglucanase n=1 Tax=Demequina litorisediminis TaxID=1849022 RepID=A0ABQ6IG24_9MICO|nr:hypothetical protein [Demequina litorisediminis]GMA36850.1 hypothetical protein GCM10025876_30540 [Demequina litorisediminis]
MRFLTVAASLAATGTALVAAVPALAAPQGATGGAHRAEASAASHLAEASATPEAATYDWSNAAISGGGYVPGIIYSQTEPGLVYARTDIGGAYRLDRATDTWVPLLDHVGWDDWNRLGVLSLATDPVDTHRVYAATGMYTNEWDPDNGAILRSDDYGETWEATEPAVQGGRQYAWAWHRRATRGGPRRQRRPLLRRRDRKRAVAIDGCGRHLLAGRVLPERRRLHPRRGLGQLLPRTEPGGPLDRLRRGLGRGGPLADPHHGGRRRRRPAVPLR